jgi:hypothetical protein
MFDVHAYLRSEFRRYYPDAARIDVHEGDETWDVGVVLPTGASIQYHMDVGSDDGCFVFENQEHGLSLTVPFAPEMSE